MSVFDRVKAAATKRGMTLRDVEDRAGLGKNSIYRWKSYTPRFSNLQKVADVLFVPVDYLLERTDNMDSVDWNQLFKGKMQNYYLSLYNINRAFEEERLDDIDNYMEFEINDEEDEILLLSTKASAFEIKYWVNKLKEDTKINNYDPHVKYRAFHFSDDLANQYNKKETAENVNNSLFELGPSYLDALATLPENDRKQLIDSAKAYVQGMIDAYSSKNNYEK
ncbi:helix-turn-helix domain-containing protein [Weissella viridescens]|uniref:helix-turn-helix domain-containing protein n=1 Tax=Weissella viridescens TaxID=1629 RepID=UPI003AF30AF3